jgi:protoporphyrinogen oxidase
MQRQAIIIGAGPAGLTAALEMLRRSDIKPIILEASNDIGGISRTVRYKGNRMDIGGHRFFSKSDRVMQWWLELMPVAEADNATISYQGRQRTIAVPAHLQEEPPLRGMGPLTHETPELLDEEEAPVPVEAIVEVPLPESDDLVMLIRPRKSRIYYLRRFFDYPITLTASTLRNLGITRMVRVGTSYAFSRVHQIKPERSLEDFLINRFGRELYLTFFKSYTEKVWGTPCHRISAEWGAQRIKGLSLTTAVKHFIRQRFKKSKSKTASHDHNDIAQKKIDTSLIERFLYPKLGPGQLWEHVAEQVLQMGGEIHMGWTVDKLETRSGDPAHHESRSITAVEAVNAAGERRHFAGDVFLSTMPIKELTHALDKGGARIPHNVREISNGLEYRDFITVGLLVDRLAVHEPDGSLLKDTWIYIQEPDVLLGRLQIFNNWSPHLIEDQSKVWIGLEYFCYDTDPLWKMPDEELKKFAIAEVAKINILRAEDVQDAHVVRVPKTYPAYFGTYSRFDELRKWMDGYSNLFLVGRNGMHKYNNQDHSMLTAMSVVDGLIAGYVDKAAIWGINTEQEYHEEKK